MSESGAGELTAYKLALGSAQLSFFSISATLCLLDFLLQIKRPFSKLMVLMMYNIYLLASFITLADLNVTEILL